MTLYFTNYIKGNDRLETPPLCVVHIILGTLKWNSVHRQRAKRSLDCGWSLVDIFTSEIMLTELFLLGVALIILWYWKTRLPSDHPPTPPIRLPILGHFHYLLMYPATKTTTGLYELYKAYSKNGVLSFHVGTQKITLIGNTVKNL